MRLYGSAAGHGCRAASRASTRKASGLTCIVLCCGKSKTRVCRRLVPQEPLKHVGAKKRVDLRTATPSRGGVSGERGQAGRRRGRRRAQSVGDVGHVRSSDVGEDTSGGRLRHSRCPFCCDLGLSARHLAPAPQSCFRSPSYQSRRNGPGWTS